MRVLHVIPGVAARYGGPTRAILGMCHALEAYGLDPLIATTDADGGRQLEVPLGEVHRYKGVPAIFFRRQFSEGFKYSRPLEVWLRRNVREFEVVEIHGVFSHSSLAAARACRQAGIPYAVRPLGSLGPWALSRKWVRKRVLWPLGVKQMLQRAAAIHYTTGEERRLAEGLCGLSRGVVVPLGVDPELLSTPIGTQAPQPLQDRLGQDPYVLTLGRLHPVKGLHLFLDVFLQVTQSREFGRWRAVVCGDGQTEYATGLRRLVRQRGGEGRVVFTGWIDGADRQAAIRGAALLALPSHQENFGLSAVEALACAVPVLVSTGVNLAAEIRAARAGWVAELSRPALSQVLTEALRDSRERAARGAAGRELVRSRFTWAAVAGVLTSLYESMIAGRT